MPQPPPRDRRSTPAASFDHLVGEREHLRRQSKAERLRGLQVEKEFEFGRQLDRQVAGFCPLQNAIDIGSGLSGWLYVVDPIASKAATHHEIGQLIHRVQTMSCCERDDQALILSCGSAGYDIQTAVRLSRE